MDYLYERRMRLVELRQVGDHSLAYKAKKSKYYLKQRLFCDKERKSEIHQGCPEGVE